MGNVTNDYIKDIDASCEYESFLCEPDRCSSIISSTKRNFNILLQNIRSINCNFDSMLALTSQLNIGIDIIVLTECWLSSASSIPLLDGYNVHTTSKTNFLQNDGVTMYLHKKRLDYGHHRGTRYIGGKLSYCKDKQ